MPINRSIKEMGGCTRTSNKVYNSKINNKFFKNGDITVSKLTLSFKSKVLKIFPLQQGLMEIGSDSKCPIFIDSLAVAQKHARIETTGANSTLIDLETEEGTFVNQQRISEYQLNDGDLIRVGKHTLSFKYEEVSHLDSNESSTSIDIHPLTEQEPATKTSTSEEIKAEPHAQGWLQILNGQNLGKTLSLNKSLTNIGKPGVATAVITRRHDGYFISHLEGKRPPMVSNEPINDNSIRLNDGDTITIGNINMQFYLE